MLLFFYGEIKANFLNNGKMTTLDTATHRSVFCLGADIENIVNQAALKAARDRLEYVTMDSLDFARDKVLMGKYVL